MSVIFNETLVSLAANVTRNAALACRDLIGKGDKKAADGVATDAMRNTLNAAAISGEVVIGEGEMDEAPMLYIGEKVGTGGVEIDIAVDPLEGTTPAAENGVGAMCVLAIAPRGSLLNAPDMYMDKLAIGGGYPENIVSLQASAADNVKALAKAKGVRPQDINVCILKRDRHKEIVASVRSVGAKVTFITDGDVGGVLSVTEPGTEIDMYLGSGGAPEGVLAAAALKAVGGQMFGRLMFESEDDQQKIRAEKLGITDLNKIYTVNDMVKGEVIFAATGVTDGNLRASVKKIHGKFVSETLIYETLTGSVQKILTRHR